MNLLSSVSKRTTYDHEQCSLTCLSVGGILLHRSQVISGRLITNYSRSATWTGWPFYGAALPGMQDDGTSADNRMPVDNGPIACRMWIDPATLKER